MVSGAGGTPAPLSYEDAVAADSPQHWWKMDETSGSTLVDSGSGGADASVVFGSLIFGQAAIGSAAGTSIDINSSRSRASTAIPGGDVTFEALIYPTSSTGNKHLFGSPAWSSNQVFMRSGNGDLNYRAEYKGATYTTSLGTLSLNTPYHVAFTFEVPGVGNPQIRAFLNGVETASTTTNPGDMGTISSWDIGNFDDNGRPFQGLMQHHAIYSSRLSDATILAHAQAAGLA